MNETTEKTKVCNKCGEEKPVDAFSANRSKRQVCKACHAEQERQYYHERKAGTRKSKPKPEKRNSATSVTPMSATPAPAIASPSQPRKLLIVRGGYAQVAEVTLKNVRAVIPTDDTKYSRLLSHAQANGYDIVFALEDAPAAIDDAEDEDEE